MEMLGDYKPHFYDSTSAHRVKISAYLSEETGGEGNGGQVLSEACVLL